MNQPTGTCYYDHTPLTQISFSTAGNSVEHVDREVETPEAAPWQEGIEDIEMGDPLNDDVFLPSNDDDPPPSNDDDPPPSNDDDPPPSNDDVPPPPNDPRRGQPFVERYEGCAEAFPGGETFMDRFGNNRYGEQRRENIYFPWASRQEWGFASWLLRSRLSMAAIDDLLSLEIVSSNTSMYSMSYSPVDQECTAILSLCKRAQSPCRNSSTWSAMAVQNINA